MTNYTEFTLKVVLRSKRGFSTQKRYLVTTNNEMTLDELISALDELILAKFETE